MNGAQIKPSDRIDLAAARALVSGYAPEEAVSVKAGSVLALIDAVEAAHGFVATTSVFRQDRESRDEFTRLAYALLHFGSDAAA